MAITLANYYEQYADGNTTGLYSQPGGYTIPNPNDPNNNNASKYQSPGGTLNNNPAPLITVPVTKGAIGNSGEGLLSAIAGGGLGSLATGFGGDALGVLNDALGGIFEDIAAGAKDAARISKFFYSTPEGIAFNLKQVGLQAMNTKIPHGGPNGGSGFLGKAANDPRIYNLGINLLAQVPLEAIDIHIERHGAYPTFKEYPNNKGVYSQYYSEKNNEAGSNISELIPNNKLIELSAIPVDLYGEWFSYGGGPKSIFGIGNTSHRRWTVSDNDPSGSTGVQPKPLPDIDTTPYPYTIPIISSTALSGLPKNLKELQVEGLDITIGKGVGRVGSRTKDERKNILNQKIQTRDIVNYTPLQKAISEDAIEQLELEQDLVNFRFESIDNDNPEKSIFIIFRSFLSSITDNYSPTWNPHKYLGRGEKVYTYSGFDRSISFSFKTAVQTREETKPIIQKLNFLASNTAPDFNTAGRMRGPFMRLTIGDYFVSLPGFISSLTYTIDDNTPWDIALYKDYDDDERQLPHIINVQVSYTPIHDFLPRKGTNNVHYMLGKQDPWITSLPSVEGVWTNPVPPISGRNTEVDPGRINEDPLPPPTLALPSNTRTPILEIPPESQAPTGDFEPSNINNLA
jgi:hypothetical protein